MRYSVVIISFFVIIMMAACHHNNDDFKCATEHLIGKVFDDERIGNGFVGIKSDTLWMSNYGQGDDVLLGFCINNDSLSFLGGGLNYGRGPGEYANIIGHIIDDSSISLLSYKGGNLGRIDFFPGKGSVLEKGIPEQSYDLTWINSMFVGDFTEVGRDSIIVVGSPLDNTPTILSCIDLKNKNVGSIQFWPGEYLTNYSLADKVILMNNTKLYYNKNKHKLLYVCGEGRLVWILDYYDNQVKGVKEIYSLMPKYTKDPQGLNFIIQRDNERGLKSFVTKKYIYLVRNGIFNFRSDEKGYPFYYRNEIEVFDWNGEITLKYIMDKPFSDFVVSSDDTTIYTLSQDVNTKEPQVVVYRLK